MSPFMAARWLVVLAIFLFCYSPSNGEISYLQISSEQVDSSEFGAGSGQKNTTCSCGWSNDEAPRIVGGKFSEENEFPMAVAVVDGYTGFVFCGAAIVTPEHAVTGAHCTWRRRVEGDPISIVVGTSDLNSENKKVVEVRRIVEHQNFDRVTLINDIAVLVLKERLVFNHKIGPACLPTERPNLDHKYVRIVGWGATKYEGSGTTKMKKVDVRVVPIKTCSFNYPGRVSANNPTQVCTFGRRKGSCQGDSGGPVIWNDPQTNRYTLIGVVSSGKLCGGTAPTINTEVFANSDWLHRTIQATSSKDESCSKVV